MSGTIVVVHLSNPVEGRLGGQMPRSTGTLRYSPKLLGERATEQWWSVLDCDPNLGRYYRHLYWIGNHRTHKLLRPSWAEHVTVIRNEEPPHPQFWGRYAGHRVSFCYNITPKTNGDYWWLEASCTWLMDLRQQLGLPRSPSIPFHVSIGHGIA